MICGVVGDPIAHSLSPLLHRAAYDACGLEWEYDAHRVLAGGLAAFVDGLDASWRGLSVTAPLKREAAERADEVSPMVIRAGVANTLVQADGRWFADNTDVPGAGAAIREQWTGDDQCGDRPRWGSHRRVDRPGAGRPRGSVDPAAGA